MVYVVQEVTGRDIMSASSFGELKLLLEPGDVVLSTEPTVRKLKKGLQTFSDDDHLLLMGDPVALGIATAVAADVNRGVVKLLKWDRRHYRYYEIVMDLHGTLRNQPTVGKVVPINRAA